MGGSIEERLDLLAERPVFRAGQLAVRVYAAEALLRNAAAVLDETASAPLTDESTARASIGRSRPGRNSALLPSNSLIRMRRSRASMVPPPPNTSTTTCSPWPLSATRKWPGKSTPCADQPLARATCSQITPRATGMPWRRSITGFVSP